MGFSPSILLFFSPSPSSLTLARLDPSFTYSLYIFASLGANFTPNWALLSFQEKKRMAMHSQHFEVGEGKPFEASRGVFILLFFFLFTGATT